MTSIVDDSFAVRAGLRNPVQTTMWPRRTRLVAIARAVRTENDSKVISSVGSGTVWKWSKTHSGLEPERLGLFGELDRPGPRVGRFPAVVLALPALGCHQPDLHPDPPGRSIVFGNGDGSNARALPTGLRGTNRDDRVACHGPADPGTAGAPILAR